MLSHEAIAGGLPEFEALGKGLVGQRRRRFVLEYVADPKRNAARAYRLAYDSAGGLSDESARVGASRLLQNDNVYKAVTALQDKIRDTALPRLLAKLDAIIAADLRDVMTWDGEGRVKMVPSRDLSPQVAAALASVQDVREERQGRLPGLDDAQEAAVSVIRKNVKLHDPLKAIEIYCKLAGLGAAERMEIAGETRVVVIQEDAVV
jgi:phage terminase small subunit